VCVLETEGKPSPPPVSSLLPPMIISKMLMIPRVLREPGSLSLLIGV